MTQLDLFLDTRAVMLANDVGDALLAGDLYRARSALAGLLSEEPHHEAAPAMSLLIDTLERWTLPEKQAQAIAHLASHIEHRIRPAAERVLGSQTPVLLAPLYRSLYQHAIGIDYDSAQATGHAAALALQCEAYPQAESAVLAIPRWHEMPDALHWLCLARFRMHGLERARPAMFALAWHAPERCEATVVTLADPSLERDWTAFLRASEWETIDPETLPAWFPAWYLIEHPASGSDLADIAIPADVPAQAAALLIDIHRLEREGNSRTLIKARATLRGLNPDLFDVYMQRRATLLG